MSRTTTNLGLTAVTNSETIGDFSDAMNASGGNLDIIDGKMGAVGNTSLQAQINTLNSKITNLPDVSYASISGSTLSAFEASIDSALGGMNTGDVRVCPAIASYSQSLTNGGQAIAFLSKPSSTVWWCFLAISSGVKAGYKTGSTWTWL